MRIYYFGELIEDTNNPDLNKTKTQQTALELKAHEPQEEKKSKLGMDSIGDLLKDLNLNVDVYRPNSSRNILSDSGLLA